MSKKPLFLMAAIIMLAAPAFGQSYLKKSLQVVDELHDPVTDITSITILDAGTSNNSTLYGDVAGNISVTNPITTISNNSTLLQAQGSAFFYTRAASYKVTITDGTYTKTFDNRTGSMTRIPFFATYIGEASSLNLGDDDDLNFGDSDDWVLTWTTGTTSLDATPAADDSAWNMGSTSKTSDFNLFGGNAGRDLYWDASENTLEVLDVAIVAWGDGDDFTISHDGSTTTTFAGTYSTTGIVTHTTDIFLDGTYDVQWDDNRYQLGFLDNAILGIGGAADGASRITLTHNATDLLMEAAVADDLWKIGYSSNFDIGIYGDTNSEFMYWDTSDELVYLEGYDMRFNDADELKFGDDSDFVIDSSTTKILDVISGETDESGAIYFGANTLGFDSKFFGATTGTYMEFDASDDELEFVKADLKIGAGSQIEFIDATAVDWTIDNATDETLLFTPTETTDDQTINFGNATNTTDFRLFGLGATTIIFDASGDEVRFNGYDVGINDDDVLMFGDANEVTMEYDEDGLDDLQVKGPVGFDTTYVEFRTNPICMTDDGSDVAGAASETDIMVCEGDTFEYFLVTAGTQAILLPTINATGLNIRLDETDNEGMEMGQGITARSPSAFIIGTDAFYLKVQFEIEAVAEMDIVAIGFRLAGAYNQDLYSYNTYAGINVDNGAINGIDAINGGSAHSTSLGQSAWTDAQIFTLEVRIDAAKAVTQYQSSQGAGNRGTSAVAAPLAFSWTDTDTVVPFIHILGDNTAGCEINLLSWECGLQ